MASASPRVFPWISLPARPAENYLGSFLDQSYRTGSITSFMPLLLLLSVWGCITTYRPKGRHGAATMRIPLLAMLAIPGAILFYGYIAYRYTSEVIPALALAGAVGYIDLARRLEARPPRWRRVALATMGLLALYGFVAHLAIAYYTNRINNPHELRDYARLQEAISDRTPGQALRRPRLRQPPPARHGTSRRVPDRGRLRRALRRYRRAPLALDARRDPRARVGPRPRARSPREGPTNPSRSRWPSRWTTPARASCCTSRTAPSAAPSTRPRRCSGAAPRPIPDDGRLRLRLVNDLGLMQYALADIDNPARGLVDIENSLPTPDWFRQQLIFEDQFDQPTTVDGVQVTPVPTAPLEYCEHLMAEQPSLR